MPPLAGLWAFKFRRQLVDLQAEQSPVVHQGRARNTCLAVAATGGHEFLRGGQRLSIEHLWASAVGLGGVSSRGATITSVRDGIVDPGQCAEAIWPYSRIRPRARPGNLGATVKVTNAQARHPDLDLIKASLRSRSAVVVGLQITEWLKLGRPLPIDSTDPNELIEPGGHAVLAVGFDDVQNTLTIKNSWGLTWGRRGYAEVTYRFFERRARRLLVMSL